MRRLILLPVLLLGCTHQPTVTTGAAPFTESEYNELIHKNTSKTDQYSGFYQTFQADMTMQNSEMRTAELKQKAHFLQWSDQQYQSEREKMLQENSAYSKFFLRFFSPENDYDDLQKPNSIWKVYLDARGQRFTGQVKKMTDKFIQIQTLFPFMDRFSTPYEITFNVPMNTLESGPCKVTLTSSLGTAEFNFPPAK